MMTARCINNPGRPGGAVRGSRRRAVAPVVRLTKRRAPNWAATALLTCDDDHHRSDAKSLAASPHGSSRRYTELPTSQAARPSLHRFSFIASPPSTINHQPSAIHLPSAIRLPCNSVLSVASILLSIFWETPIPRRKPLSGQRFTFLRRCSGKLVGLKPGATSYAKPATPTAAREFSGSFQDISPKRLLRPPGT